MESEPDLSFCGLSLWVQDRQFPDASDYWDGNWRKICAKMEASGAFVQCGGPILTTADVERFRDELVSMVSTPTGEAVLTGLEPGLYMILKMRSRGRVDAVIEISGCGQATPL